MLHSRSEETHREFKHYMILLIALESQIYLRMDSTILMTGVVLGDMKMVRLDLNCMLIVRVLMAITEMVEDQAICLMYRDQYLEEWIDMTLIEMMADRALIEAVAIGMSIEIDMVQ